MIYQNSYKDEKKLVRNISRSSNSSLILSDDMRDRIDLTLQVGMQDDGALPQECHSNQSGMTPI